MKKSYFEYFLNAVHYSIWVREKKITSFMMKISYPLFSKIVYPFFSDERKKYHQEQMKEFKKFSEDERAGMDIGLAHHIFGSFYSMYPGYISFVLLGVHIRYFSNNELLEKFVPFLLILIPIGLCYIPAYKALYHNDRYLEYFKAFKKNDRQWHKKWMRITTIFQIGGIIAVALGVLSMIAIG